MSKLKATDGKEFEIVDTGAYGHFALRAVKVEPKKLEWTLALYAVGEFDLIRENYQLTKAQAQLIKEVVDKLMEYINLEISPSEIEHQGRERLRYAADKARNALKEGLHEV